MYLVIGANPNILVRLVALRGYPLIDDGLVNGDQISAHRFTRLPRIVPRHFDMTECQRSPRNNSVIPNEAMDKILDKK